jgi:hypothetical protein
MAKGGPSISVKMILTTTLLIVVTGVGAGLLNVMNVKRAIDEAANKRVALFQDSRKQIGQLGAPLFARATEALIIEKGRDKEILTLVQNAVREDNKDWGNGKNDYVLKLAYVLDQNKNVIAHCIEGTQLDCKALDPHAPVSAALGPATVDSWSKVQAAWEAGAKSNGNPLVDLTMSSGGSNYLVYAYPIFVGEPATAAGAAAAEPPQARQGYVVLGYDLEPVAWYKAEANEQKAAAVIIADGTPWPVTSPITTRILPPASSAHVHQSPPVCAAGW